MTPRVIAAFLALGVAANVAVAWTCALVTDIRHGRVLELYEPLGGERHWEVFRWDRLGGTRILSQTWTGFAPGPYNEGDPGLLLASWGVIDTPTRDALAARSQIDEAWGLPMRTLAFGVDSRPTPSGEATTTAHLIRVRERDGATRGIYLPRRILWPGVAVNTVFYALLAMIAHAVTRDVARIVRRRADVAA